MALERLTIITGGIDNDLVLIDVSKSITEIGESALTELGITANRNMVPCTILDGLDIGSAFTIGGTHDLRDG